MKRILIILFALTLFSCGDNETIEFDCECRVATYFVQTKQTKVDFNLLDAKCSEENKHFNKNYDSNGGLISYSYLVCNPK